MMPAMENSLVTNFLLQTILFDKHCSISASGELHVYHNVTDDASLSDTTRIKRWNDDCSQTFVSNLNTDTIDVILSSMPAVDIVDKDSISIMIQLLLFLKLLKKTCGTSKRTQKVNNCSKSTSNQKPWLDNECNKEIALPDKDRDGRPDGRTKRRLYASPSREHNNARKYYHRCRKKYNMVKTIDIKNDMATSSKPYKKLFSKTY